MRKKAQQTIRKLLSSLGGSSLAHGLLGELRVVINKHKVRFFSIQEKVILKDNIKLQFVIVLYNASRLNCYSCLCFVTFCDIFFLSCL